MILPIRPHYLFDKVPLKHNMVTVPLPLRQAGSPSLLETYLLLAVGRIVQPQRIFEIGTFLGQTARNLARNFPEAEVLTLDVDAKRSGLKKDGRIVPLEGHSMNFDFSPWHGSCDLVFIDGGHDYATVKADTLNAMKLLRSAPPPVTVAVPQAIVWHDYANPQFADVTKYLLSRAGPILHVLETQIAVYFSYPVGSPE